MEDYEVKRILDFPEQTTLPAGTYVGVDSSGSGTKKFDLGSALQPATTSKAGLMSPQDKAALDQNGEDITDLKSGLGQVISDLGGNVAYEITTGKSIAANVGGVVSFLDNANRMYLQFSAVNTFSITNNQWIAFIVADGNNKCVSNSGWTQASINDIEANASYTYYILCDFIDTTKIPTIKYSEGIVNEVDECEQKITILEYDNLAQRKGYYSVVPLIWESGAFNIPSGTDNNSANVIRTPLPRLQFPGDVKVLMADDKYRFRIIGAVDETSSATFDSGWLRSLFGGEEEYTLTVDTSMYYRIQIATNTASSMDMSEALQSLLFVYASDSMSEIKSFWESYIENKSYTINNYMTNGNEKTAFLFLTDTHWNESTVQLNHYGINTYLMKYIADHCNIQYVIHGGDLNSENRSNINVARELMTIPVGMMRDAFEHVLLTRGNHDDNNESGNRNWAYTISQSDSYSYMFRNTKNVVFGETGTYFYKDIPFEKVRIISLDCVDFPYTNNIDATMLDEKILAYGYNQLQWFCDTLKSTPSDYHIVIYTHAMIAPSIVTIEHPNESPQTRTLNYGVVARILKAYKERVDFSLDITGWFTSVNQSYFDGVLEDDFTACDATIVGVFSGHEHIDCIEEIEVDNVGIGIYNTCTQNSSAMFGDSVISHSYQHPMQIGTTSELVWDIVVIDKPNKHVDMIRIGANGANTDVESFEVRSFNYS